jgi:GT2 family glycosyltransferase
MNITFGICVSPNHNHDWLENLIDSIHSQEYDAIEYEIILEHDDSEKPGCISAKKNNIAKKATYGTLCIMNDNMLLDKNWYTGIKRFGQQWNILCNPVYTAEGTRHVSWNVNPFYMHHAIRQDSGKYIPMLMNVAPHENEAAYVNGLPYDVGDLSHIQYIGGAYILCRKSVIEAVPFNEDIVYGMGVGEDVEWSYRLNKAGYTFRFNPYSECKIQRPNRWTVPVMPDEFVTVLRDIFGSSNSVE